jgi:hypothetical protein
VTAHGDWHGRMSRWTDESGISTIPCEGEIHAHSN